MCFSNKWIIYNLFIIVVFFNLRSSQGWMFLCVVQMVVAKALSSVSLAE